jgi:phosphoribosylamine---glycine ligase
VKVLVISSVGDAGELDLCLKAQGAGHVVKWFKPANPRTENIGKGMVERVGDWRRYMTWADLVIMGDNTKYTKEIDLWRPSGVKIIGASTEAASWELNRTKGQKIFEDHGIPVVPYKEFSDYDAAIEYVKKENRRFVSKPCGDEPDKSLSYVAKSPEDMVFMLGRWKKRSTLKGKFILQDFIPGIEMAVGGFFGPGGFNEGWLENWEEKALMAGGTGPSTGESGTTMRYVKKSKLADKVLKPLEDALDRVKYCGYIDVNTIIAEDGVAYPLEFTARFGYPTINIQQELHETDLIQWLADLAHGQDGQHLKLNRIASGLVVAIPDYPTKSPLEKVLGIPVYGLTPSLHQHVHPACMMWGTGPQEINGKIVEAPMPLTAGDYVLITSGSGDTVCQARDAALRVAKRLKIPSSPFWRPDIGNRLRTQLPKLAKMGYAQNLNY